MSSIARLSSAKYRYVISTIKLFIRITFDYDVIIKRFRVQHTRWTYSFSVIRFFKPFPQNTVFSGTVQNPEKQNQERTKSGIGQNPELD